MFIVGSRALQFHAEQRSVAYRPVRDLDLNMRRERFEQFISDHNLKPEPGGYPGKYIIRNAPEYGQIEIELCAEGNSNEMYWSYMCHREPLRCMRVYGDPAVVAPTSVLYSIKRSHRFYPHLWAKHIKDYHLLKSWVGEDVIPEITKLREAETKARYGALKTPSLKQTVSDFFDDNVSNRHFIHDQIHQVMAHREKPMYAYYQPDPTVVKCDKNLFFALPYEDQLRGVLEEAYVIALERGIIPMLYQGDRYLTPDGCFNWAIMRICTTLTSGWFREFAVENYPAIIAAADKDYVKKFLTAVDDGRIERVSVAHSAKM